MLIYHQFLIARHPRCIYSDILPRFAWTGPRNKLLYDWIKVLQLGGAPDHPTKKISQVIQTSSEFDIILISKVYFSS